LPTEASARQFFRLHHLHGTYVAMVYPKDNAQEIQRIVKLDGIYRQFALNVPQIIEVIDNRIVIQQDLGNVMMQKAYQSATLSEKQIYLKELGCILLKLRQIPLHHTDRVLDEQRLHFEMGFFVEHFAKNYFTGYPHLTELTLELNWLCKTICGEKIFAHRDFHMRNMMLQQKKIYVIDFQDSLQAPIYYDLVSLAFDAYLDFRSFRKRIFEQFKEHALCLDMDLLYLTALQRNIKALGTFGFQIHQRNKKIYKRYIPRTIRHILGNPLVCKLPHLNFLKDLQHF
jgi:aminoglycoside/choline kinase family phosphotransferase